MTARDPFRTQGHSLSVLSECPGSKIEGIVEHIWGSKTKLRDCVSKTLQARFDRQAQKLVDAPDDRRDKISAAIDRAWIALDQDARERGHSPTIDAWIGINETSGEPVVVSGAKLKIEGVAVFHPSELVKFIPPEVMKLKGTFDAHVASWKYTKSSDEVPFDDPIPF